MRWKRLGGQGVLVGLTGCLHSVKPAAPPDQQVTIEEEERKGCDSVGELGGKGKAESSKLAHEIARRDRLGKGAEVRASHVQILGSDEATSFTMGTPYRYRIEVQAFGRAFRCRSK